MSKIDDLTKEVYELKGSHSEAHKRLDRIEKNQIEQNKKLDKLLIIQERLVTKKECSDKHEKEDNKKKEKNRFNFSKWQWAIGLISGLVSAWLLKLVH